MGRIAEFRQRSPIWLRLFLRWGGLASILAGVWWLAIWIGYSLALSDDFTLLGLGPPDYLKLTLVAWLLLAAAVTSLWLHLGIWGTQNRVLLWSYIAAMVGLGMLVAGAILSYWLPAAEANTALLRAGSSLRSLGTLLFVAGVGLIGIGNLRFRGLPRWNAMPAIVAFLALISAPYLRPGSATDLLFGVGSILLGVAMWPGGTVDRHPERRRTTRMRRLH